MILFENVSLQFTGFFKSEIKVPPHTHLILEDHVNNPPPPKKKKKLTKKSSLEKSIMFLTNNHFDWWLRISP